MFEHAKPTTMLAVKDLGRARKFYEGILGLTPVGPEDSEVQMYQTGDARLAVYVSQYAGTNRATALTWEVENVEDTVRDLKARGIGFEHYDLPDTTRQGDVHVSGPVKNAWFKDPDGNILAIMSGMEVAKAKRSGVAAGARSSR
jgi:catechol 2,3-dioxygenase-like lactoylglutathione lyase family enzyme